MEQVINENGVYIKALITTNDSIQKVLKERESETPVSTRLKGDPYSRTDYGGLISPPFSYDTVYNLSDLFWVHSACLDMISSICSRGWKISRVEEGQKVEGDKTKIEEDENRKKLNKFFKYPNTDRMGYLDVTKLLVWDLSEYGNAWLEIAVDNKGTPRAMWYLPTREMRVLKEDSELYKKGFYACQYNGRKKVYFRKFGKLPGENIREMNREKKESIPDEEGKPVNSVLHIKEPTGGDSYYGIPTWIRGGIPVIASAGAAIRYNLGYLVDNKIPRYAVIIKATVSNITPDRLRPIENLVTTYFRERIQRIEHSTLVISTTTGIEIEFQPLSSEQKEGSFYELLNNSTISVCGLHNVPPQAFGIEPPGKLGGKGSTESQLERFRRDKIIPILRRLEENFAYVIGEGGFEIEDWKLEFEKPSIEDLERELEEYKTLFDTASITSNEIRERRDLPPLDDEMANIPLKFMMGGGQAGGMSLTKDMELKALQEATEDLKRELEAITKSSVEIKVI